jgi:hypothetical protein
MKPPVTLHLMGWDKKFVLPFMEFLHTNFPNGNHHFIVYGDVKESDVPCSPHTDVMPSLIKHALPLALLFSKSDKIIIHGLFCNRLMFLLTMQPWLLKRCYWVMWGGDLYAHDSVTKDWRWRKDEYLRRFIIKRIGHFVTYIQGDYELAKKWYGANGEYHNCFMYQSNLYKDYAVPPKPGDTKKILVGNSADPTNNHQAVLERLRPYKAQDIQILCPLSYGSLEHANRIASLGKEMFGDKFIPIVNFMPSEKYLELLGQIDIAVFAHKRQQGMGNTISLLGLGKKLFLRSDTTQWQFLRDLGLKVFDIDCVELSNLDVNDRVKNQQILKACMSHEKLVLQWFRIFKG